MPTKRMPLDRRRTPPISSETLALFVELENTPPRRRHSQRFKQRDRELHDRLGLGGDWLCDGCSVTDPRRKSYREGLHHEAWSRVREVRLRLLAMAGLSEPPPSRRAS